MNIEKYDTGDEKHKTKKKTKRKCQVHLTISRIQSIHSKIIRKVGKTKHAKLY